MGTEGTPQQVGLYLSSLAWAGRGGIALGYPQFPKQALLPLGGATLSLSYERMPLPVHNMGMLHTGFALGLISSACFSAQVLLGCTASRSCCQPFWSDGAKDTLHSAWGCDSDPCLGMGKLLWGYPNSSFEDMNQTNLHL